MPLRLSGSSNLPAKKTNVGSIDEPLTSQSRSSSLDLEQKLRHILVKKSSVPQSKPSTTPTSTQSFPSAPRTCPIRNRFSKDSMTWDFQTEDTLNDSNSISAELFTSSSLPTPSKSSLDSLLSSKHWSEKSLSEMTPRDWRILREDFYIRIKGNTVNPIRNWNEASIDSELLAVISSFGFKTPTPVQMQAIPVALDCHDSDLIAIAKTGSGKTLAYLIPLFEHILNRPKITPINADLGPYALIIGPTRELVNQIHQEALKIAPKLGINIKCLFGGVSLESQCSGLSAGLGFDSHSEHSPGVHLIIATPGRLKDAVSRRFISLAQCDSVVLDECDKMIALGFIDQIESILSFLPASNTSSFEFDRDSDSVLPKVRFRKTLMFSATFPQDLEDIALKFLRNPVFLAVGTVGKVSETVTQKVIFCRSEANKKNKLVEVISQYSDTLIIVFVNTKKSTDNIAKFLRGNGLPAQSVHGGKTQEQRQSTMSGFKSSKFDVLVATDLAGRGLDISEVSVVINFELPTNIDDYVHRLGRTGRAGREGVAVSLVDEGDSDMFYDLRKMLIDCNQAVPSELEKHEKSHVQVDSRNRRSKIFTV
ncbi:hypothetical protein GEMRC1_002852 [Eukaryota sp. GEM-RC1]